MVLGFSFVSGGDPVLVWGLFLSCFVVCVGFNWVLVAHHGEKV